MPTARMFIQEGGAAAPLEGAHYIPAPVPVAYSTFSVDGPAPDAGFATWVRRHCTLDDPNWPRLNSLGTRIVRASQRRAASGDAVCYVSLGVATVLFYE